jgi:hypothetical protein
MTDAQLLISIRQRACSRLGNFMFVKILDQLIIEARNKNLECNILNKLKGLCVIYKIRLIESDVVCINQSRSESADQDRCDRLRKVGFDI